MMMMMIKGVCAIANLALTDVQWLQASLPVKEDGLGVRRVTSLAPSAFLASATGTETLQQQLLHRSTQAGSTDTTVTSVRDVHVWSSLYNDPSPPGAAACKSAWDKVVVASEREALVNSLSDNVDKARLLAVTAPLSGDWLYALPLPS